jgi:hypothetical protein
MTPVKDPKGLSQGKPWPGRFSDFKVIYDVLYHIGTFIHKRVLDLPITCRKFRRSLYYRIMIDDLLQGNENTTDLNNAMCCKARYAGVEADIYLLP